jgi:hypothetical protein
MHICTSVRLVSDVDCHTSHTRHLNPTGLGSTQVHSRSFGRPVHNFYIIEPQSSLLLHFRLHFASTRDKAAQQTETTLVLT